jgi:hypothetical protein
MFQAIGTNTYLVGTILRIVSAYAAGNTVVIVAFRTYCFAGDGNTVVSHFVAEIAGFENNCSHLNPPFLCAAYFNVLPISSGNAAKCIS